jgi:hypothetical protein
VNHPTNTSASTTLWIPGTGTNRATASMDLLAKQILCYWFIVNPILLDCGLGYIYFPVRQGVEDMPGLEADTWNMFRFYRNHLKGLSHEIDFKNVDENGQILALTRAAAGF